MKKWVKALLILSMTFLLIISVAGIYLYWNRETLKQQALETLKAETGAVFSIQSIHFNVFSFPDFSIRFDSVTVSDSNIAIHQSPVLKLGQMELKASLLSLLQGSIHINSIRFLNGKFLIEKYHDGSHNFLFFNKLAFESVKEKETTTDNEPFQFKIKQLYWENVVFDFNDSLKQKRILLTLQKVKQKFTTSDSAIHFNLDGNILVGQLGFNLENGSFVANTLLETEFALSWNPGKKELSWQGSRFKARKHLYELNGKLLATDPLVLDLRISTKNVFEKDVLPLLASPVAQKVGLYQAEGPIDAEAIIGGPIVAGEDPEIYIGFSGVNQKFTAKTMGQSFYLNQFNGFYSNRLDKSKPIGDQNSKITISQVKGIWQEIPFIVNGEIEDFEEPYLVGFVHIPLTQKQMADLSKSIPFSPVESSGWLKANYDGPIEDLISTSKNFGIGHWKGNAFFAIKSAGWKESDLLFKNMEVKCQIIGDTLKIRKMRGTLNGNLIEAGGKISGLAHHIANASEPVSVSLTAHSKKININSLLSSEDTTSKAKTKKGQTGHETNNIRIKLAFRADKIRFRSLDGSNFSGKLELKNNNLQLDNLTFKTGGGQLQLQASIKNLTGNKKELSSSISIQKMDASKLLLGMDQFGQQVFRSENIEAKLNLKGNLSFHLDKNFNLNRHSVLGDISFQLRGIKLHDFTPLTELSGFILPKESLQHIEIANLNNTFHFYGAKIAIDEMEIPTSLATFYLQGEYDFANHLDLSILVPLHSISRKNHNEVIKRGLKDKSRPAIPLRVYKKDGKVEIVYDKDRAKKRFWKRVKSWTS